MTRSVDRLTRRTPRHGFSALLGAVVLSLVALMWTSTSGTLSGWSSVTVQNNTDTAAALSLAFTHSAGSCTLGPRVSASALCPGSPLPASASAASAVTGTDGTTNNGTAVSTSFTRSVSGSSCATVKLDDAQTTSNDLLPRYNVAFQQSDPYGATSAITLNGSSYATAIATTAEAAASGKSYGLGVWFKASSGQAGALFSLDASAVNAGTTNSDDRTLYLDSAGKLVFVYQPSGTKLTSTGTYADGAWHFAYLLLTMTSATASSTKLYVGTTAAVTAEAPTTGSAYGTTSGYWHLGWGSTTLMGTGSTAYFTGSLSNFVVFNSGTAAAPTASNLSTQANFNSWATGATDLWPLNDSGTTTYAGSQPVIGATSPCTYLNIGWTFANPTATAVTTMALSAFANGTTYPVSPLPGPSLVQTGTITITRASGYNTYVAGLRLYVPLVDKISSGVWAVTFVWITSDAVVLA